MVFDKVINRIGKTSVAMIKSLVVGSIRGLYRATGRDYLVMMVKNNWHTIPLLLEAVRHQTWGYPKNIPPEKIAVLENFRRRVAPNLVKALFMAREITKPLAPLIMEKLDKGWIERRLKEIDPGLLEEIKSIPGGDKWLEEEALILRRFLLS